MRQVALYARPVPNPSPDRLSEALTRLGAEDRVLLELLLADGRTDVEIGSETGMAAAEVPWRRAELLNAVAQDAGPEGPEASWQRQRPSESWSRRRQSGQGLCAVWDGCRGQTPSVGCL